MISTKRYVGVNGSTTRFLSDFIIRSESHVRCYAYVYDAACSGGGTCDTLTAGGLYIRELDAPQNNDLISVNLWDLVDNSIVFYTAPEVGATLVLEVATTPEEFGDAIAQPIVIEAQQAADASAVSAAESAASAVDAAASATSIDPTTVLHTIGYGGADPVSYTQAQLDTSLGLKADVNDTSGTGVVYLPAGTTAQRPTLGATDEGIRYNTDLSTFEGWDGTAWGGIGGGATGGGSDKVFVLNEQTVATSYTIPTASNAHSAGAIAIDTGAIVTIPTGSVWVISGGS